MSETPEPLDLVQRFVNTADVEGTRERLPTPEALREWLADAGVLAAGASVTGADLTRAREIRDAIRALGEANNGLRADATAAVSALNAAAERARLMPELDAHGATRLRPRAGGVDAALGVLVAELHEAAAAGTLERLKACGRDSCRWLFYDRSKNRAGHWCDPADCGAKERSRRAYRRRRGAGGDAPAAG